MYTVVQEVVTNNLNPNTLQSEYILQVANLKLLMVFLLISVLQ